MKKLTACLLVLSVAMALSLTLVPNGVSQASTVKIVSYSYYIDSLGYLMAVGEVQNTGPNTIEHVYVTGTVSTTDGLEASSGVTAWGSHLTPNQKAPFYLEFHSQSNLDGTFYGLTIADITLQVAEAPATAQYQYPDLTIISQQATQTAVGEFFVDCQLKNTGSQTALNAIMSVTFYNSTGQVVAVGFSNQTDISPQASTHLRGGAFDLNQTIVPADRKIESYSVLVQVTGPLLEGTAPVAVATPTPGPVVIETPDPNAGSNNGGIAGADQSLTLGIGIVVVVVVAVVVLMLLTRRRKAKKAPAASVPSSKNASGKSKTKRK